MAMAMAGPESARQLHLTPSTSHDLLPAWLQTWQLDGLPALGHAHPPALTLVVPWAWWGWGWERWGWGHGWGWGQGWDGDGEEDGDGDVLQLHPSHVPSQAAVSLNGAAAPPAHQSIPALSTSEPGNKTSL